MANRSKIWRVTAGETVGLAKDLSADLDSDESLTGTPTVTIYSDDGDGTWTDETANFTLANVQVNTEAITLSNGSTIAVGDGVEFRLTATETPGTYYVVVECDGDDGSHPASDPITLIVQGPAAQG